MQDEIPSTTNVNVNGNADRKCSRSRSGGLVETTQSVEV